MRIAVVSDIHGNLTALEAVLADLQVTAPDLVLQGGDLADGGSSPAQVVDIVRGLGWPGVVGNGEQMLCAPETLQAFAAGSAAPASLFAAVEEMAAWSREALGEERLGWLTSMPAVKRLDELALVHAQAGDPWRAPAADASDAELESAYKELEQPVVVYGHIHQGFARHISGMTVANAGSVGLPYDGNPRAAYLLVEDGVVTLRRVDYNVEHEAAALVASGMPHADWVTRMVRSGRPQLP